MTSSLRDRARSGDTRPARPTPIDDRGAPDVASTAVGYGEDLPLPEIEALVATPVGILWARLMRDVRSVERMSNLPVQGKTIKFRGINEVIHAMSNAVRKYGLIIAPVDVNVTMSDTATSKGTAMRECVAVVRYAVMGPAGDRFEFVGVGQAADTGDRAATKAERVAYRNGILDVLLASTGAPDPEETEFERGVPQVSPEQYRTEILDPATTAERLRQIRKEFGEAGRLDFLTTDAYGDDVTWRALIDHVGKARKEGRDPYPPRKTEQPADEPPADGGEG